MFRGLSFWNKLKMSGAEDQMEIKFRLIDGSDIGPKIFPTATSVATLKENIIAQWPKGWSIFFFSLQQSYIRMACLVSRIRFVSRKKN